MIKSYTEIVKECKFFDYAVVEEFLIETWHDFNCHVIYYCYFSQNDPQLLPFTIKYDKMESD